jgi:hypothetical protein
MRDNPKRASFTSKSKVGSLGRILAQNPSRSASESARDTGTRLEMTLPNGRSKYGLGAAYRSSLAVSMRQTGGSRVHH